MKTIHNTAWKNGDTGQVADPFTIVSHQDVVDQKYVPSFGMGVWEGQPVTSLEWAKKYTKALEDYGRSQLCLWPPHCLIGDWGNRYDNKNDYLAFLEIFLSV